VSVAEQIQWLNLSRTEILEAMEVLWGELCRDGDEPKSPFGTKACSKLGKRASPVGKRSSTTGRKPRRESAVAIANVRLMTIEILPSAEDDLVDGAAFYEESETGIGDYFLRVLCSEIDGLKRNAGSHREFFGHHRMLSKTFPIGVFYQVTARWFK